MLAYKFFETRKLAREAKADLNGKVKDFGSTAEVGKRWAVEYEQAEQVEAKDERRQVLHLNKDIIKHLKKQQPLQLRNHRNRLVNVQIKRTVTYSMA